MKEFKLQTSIKFALFIFAVTMAFIILWINATIIFNLREGNRQQLEKIAKSYSDSISNSTDEELAFIINILLPSLNFPIIITITKYSLVVCDHFLQEFIGNNKTPFAVS